ncbi:G-protein coupled receptor 35-like [Tachyglossus aculeatus]|uniref:G-protein coupled receptor 35-like n=1 Tax=Tachyglossus aculeatus TaxID=9261 RepID=UPI0018F4824F|nr:G-protein coupled receptor 35-like [Tachyglossus aculeatus]
MARRKTAVVLVLFKAGMEESKSMREQLLSPAHMEYTRSRNPPWQGTYLQNTSTRKGIRQHVGMNHPANCSTHLNHIVAILQVVLYIPLFFLGVVFNVLAFWVFCFKLKRWTETRVFMTNLVIADSCLLFSFPFMLYVQLQQWQHDTVCLILESVYFINRFMSISTIMAIAIDRYIAIAHPLKAPKLRSPQKAALFCGLLWVLMCISFIYQDGSSVHETRCFLKTSTTPSLRTLILFLLGFLVPLIILSFCSIHIIVHLRRKLRTRLEERRLARKAIRIISVNMITFVICFLPVNLGHFIRFILDSIKASCGMIQKASLFIQVSSLVANINCCLDVLCYYLVATEFQEASLLINKCKSWLSGANETQETKL